MKPLFIFFCTLLYSVYVSIASAQTHTPRYITITNKSKAYYEYLPEGYDSTATATYPLLLFITGIGEFGNGSATSLPLF